MSAETAGSSLLVLPVYARFLKFEAWQCVVWGVFFFWSSYYDVSRQVPRGVIVLTQVARYVASFTWALCGEGVFLFLCLDSAGIESLHTAVRLAAAWACALVGGCSFLWLSWAGCTAPPDDSWVLQALWVGAWVPYWMRLFLMPLFYGPALLLLSMPHRRAVARERGSLLLCVYNLATSALYLAPKVLFGVFGDAAGDDTAETWLLGDAVSIPLAWLLYVPFLAHVLQRDSAFWLRCGFTACVLGDRAAGAAGNHTPHRVPLLANRAKLHGSGQARFMVIDPASLRFRRVIGRGATSVVSAATLYDEPVAVKQMQVKQLTRSFATVFLTEAECLSHCRHPHIVRFVGGCVAPPLVCLVMEVCDSSVHRLLHPRGAASDEQPLPLHIVCGMLRGIVSGMQFMHSTMGVVHGDLKPLNLLLQQGQARYLVITPYCCSTRARYVT